MRSEVLSHPLVKKMMSSKMNRTISSKDAGHTIGALVALKFMDFVVGSGLYGAL